MLSSRKNDLEISKREHRSRSPYSPSFKQRKHGSSSPPKHRHLAPRERDSARNADRRHKNLGNHHVFRAKHAGENEGVRGTQKRPNNSARDGQKKEYSRYMSHDADGTSHRSSPLPKRPRTLPPASTSMNSSSKKKSVCSNQHRSSKVTVETNKASLVKKEAKVKSPKSTEPLFSPVKSLKPFLEDIDSDEDIEPPPPAPLPPVDIAVLSPPPPEESKGKVVDSIGKVKEEQKPGPSREGDVRKLSKEELYLLMEQLDTDITMTEQTLGIAKDKQAVFEGSDYVYHVPTAAAFMTINDEKCHAVECAIKASALHEAIYRENRLCVSQAQASAPAEVKPLLTNPEPLYRQPCEAPGYSDTVEQHRRMRPLLLQHLVKRRKEQHKMEVELQERYDHLSEQWEKKVEQAEQLPRKKIKDQKNRELFEKLFPELKRIKEPSEKINRIDARGINIVRSDAEFHELMDALHEQAESKDRHRRCHAAIPAMALHPEDQRVRFMSLNGLLADPLAERRRDTCLASWSEEEKLTFKRVYALHPKNFEKIAKFLPKKTVQQCVQFYYLTKKKEKYKVLVNAVREERKRRGLPRAAQDSPTTPVGPLLAADSKGARVPSVAVPGPSRRPTLLKPKPTGFGDWSDAEIERLRDGMRTHGRMWSKVSRYVGTSKTAGHCKSFFQEHQSNHRLQLGQALEEHVRNKNLVRMKSKEEAKLEPPPASKGSIRSRSGSVPSKQEEVSVDTEGEEGEVTLQSESGSESGSSSTCTADSSEEETVSEEEEEVVSHKHNFNPRRTHFPSDSVMHRYSEDSLDVLFSAAEIVEGAVSADFALHDHTYALPHDILYHNMDMSATSGLSLIAAAAAVVSPTLSSSSGASPLFTPVKAPRGRPPNSSKRSSLNQRLQPTYLSPAGPGLQVTLTDQRVAGLRGRSRSTGTNVRPPMPQQVSPSSTPLSKMQPAKCVLTATQPKPATPLSLPMLGRVGPGGVASAPATPSSPGSAFEALVNVAAAAPPAEMPSPGGGGGEGKPPRPPVLGPKAVVPTLQPQTAPGLPQLKPAVPGGTPSDGRSPPLSYGIFFHSGSYPAGSSSGSAQSWVPHHPPWGFQVFGNGGMIYSPSSGNLMYPHQPAYPGHIPMMHTFHGGFPPRGPHPPGQFAGGGMMPNNSAVAAGSGFGHAAHVARPPGGGGQQSDSALSSSTSASPATSTAVNSHSVANLLGSTSGASTNTSMSARHPSAQARESSSASPVPAFVPTSGKEIHPLHPPASPQPKARDCVAPSTTEQDGTGSRVETVNDSNQSSVDGYQDARKNPAPAGEEGRGKSVIPMSPDMPKGLRTGGSLCPSVLLAEDSNGSDDQLNDLDLGTMSNLLNHRSSVSDLDGEGPSVDDELADSESFGPILPNVNLDPSTCTLPPTSLQFNPERFSPNMAAMSLFSSVTSGNSKESCASPSPTPQAVGYTMSDDAITDQGHNGPS